MSILIPIENLYLVEKPNKLKFVDSGFVKTCDELVNRIKSSSPEKNCDPNNRKRKESLNAVLADSDAMKLVPPQWVQCDLRNLNLSTLGKFTGKKWIFLKGGLA